MSTLAKILTGTAGLAAVVGVASPAAAQYYPNNGYGYPNQGGNVIGQVLRGVLGGGQYGGYGYNGYNSNTQVGVQQCAAAVQQRLGGGYGNGGHDAYGNYAGGYGNGGYASGGGRVLGITHADRHGSGRVKVKGVATSGMAGGYGGYGGGQADLSFNCTVDRYGRITHLDVNRRNNGHYRGY